MTIVIVGAFSEFHISLCSVLKEITTGIEMGIKTGAQKKRSRGITKTFAKVQKLNIILQNRKKFDCQRNFKR